MTAPQVVTVDFATGATRTRDPDTDLRVAFGHIEPRAARVHQIHLSSPALASATTASGSVPGRARKIRSLTLVLEGNNPRFSWEPSATMLTYRLAGTTEAIGVQPGRTPVIVACDIHDD